MNDLIMRFGIPYRKKVTAKMIGIYFEYKEVRTNNNGSSNWESGSYSP